METTRKIFTSFSGMVLSISGGTSTIDDIHNGFVFPACSTKMLEEPYGDRVLLNVNMDLMDDIITAVRKAMDERRCVFFRWSMYRSVPGWIAAHLTNRLIGWEGENHHTDTDVLIAMLAEHGITDVPLTYGWYDWPEVLYRRRGADIELWNREKMIGDSEHNALRVRRELDFKSGRYLYNTWEKGVGELTLGFYQQADVLDKIVVSYLSTKEPNFTGWEDNGVGMLWCRNLGGVRLNGVEVEFTSAHRESGVDSYKLDLAAVTLLLHDNAAWKWLSLNPVGGAQ